MSKTIWKYTLETTDRQAVEMPRGAKVIALQVQNGDRPCLWIELDPTELHVSRVFHTYGTGHKMPDNPGKYVGTYQLNDGRFVFHVYEAV